MESAVVILISEHELQHAFFPNTDKAAAALKAFISVLHTPTPSHAHTLTLPPPPRRQGATE